MKGGPHDSGASTAESSVVEMYCPVCDSSFDKEAVHCPDDGAKLVRITEKKDSMIGRVLDERFTIKSKLGAGGMGAVYRALQHSVGREVAIKVIEPRLAERLDITKRFLREAQLSSKLSQPNTVTVLDFGQTTDGLLYLVMELLNGRGLDAILKAEGALPENRVVRIGIQICDALDAAQALHIVHRDLKPANIVILDDPPGRDMVKVLDFGIAKSLAGDNSLTTMTGSDMILGTPSYIAPEAIAGSNVDARADLYSVGIILYECATGELPFNATTINSMLASHTSEPPRPLPDHISIGLKNTIAKLLAKDPDDRYQNAAECRSALSALRGDYTDVEAFAATATPTGLRRPPERSDVAFAETSMTPASEDRGVGLLTPRPEILPEPRPVASGLGRTAVRGVIAFLIVAVVAGAYLANTHLGSAKQTAGTHLADAGMVTAAAKAEPDATASAGHAAPTDAAPSAGHAAPPDAAANKKYVQWKLYSEPPGASVRLLRDDGTEKRLCPTPCIQTLLAGEGRGRLRFSKAGYRATTREGIDLSADLDLEEKERRPVLLRRAQPSAAPSSTPDDGNDEGFLSPSKKRKR